jgi:DNA polymerase-3 subunit alpha
MSRFVHLHTHSHYSFLEALPKVEELVTAAKKNGMDAVGLTDSGNMHGAIEFYKAAEEEGIKAILGVDTFVAPRSRFEKDRVLDAKRSRIVLLAENNEGYKNLLALVTKSYVEGFFEKPRVDKDLLREYSKGLIALIPSFAGEIPLMLAAGDANGAAAALAEYKSIFANEDGTDTVFLEITHHPSVVGHEEKMQKVIELARSTGTPLVAQHDVYYIKPDDRDACEVLRRIQHGSQGRNEQEDFSFISEKEALKLFKDTPEAVTNSRVIANRCNLSFELGKWIFPNIPTLPGMTHDQELREKTFRGITARGMEQSELVLERIEYELDIITTKGFAPYFLAVSDLLTFAKSAGILTTTRGSAAGSLVAYLTGITNVDPLYYKLPFERFLNPQRPKAPDIDMDIADNRRDEMIAYAKRKYGDDHVAQIGTFGTMAARAAVRDISRALGHSYSVGDRIAKLIPIGSQGFPMTIERALKIEKDLKALYDEDEDAKEIIDLAKRIEGCVRHVGVHAAGVVISPTPLIEWTPLQPDPKSTDENNTKLITQFDMYSISDEYGGVGLLKFDFLGIKNLSILSDAVDRVREGLGMFIDIETIPIDDHKTFEMLARGETEGLFQLSGSGMTRYLKELRPTTIHDINAMVALYRPGPMEVIPEYIARKNNAKLIKYLDPRMEKFLTESYGLLVYQDDLLYCAVDLAGYSWLDVDKFRKAIGKKNPVEMAKQKKQFTEGIVTHGQTAAFADKLWLLFEPFQAYGFNKCLTADTKIYNAELGTYDTIKELLSRDAAPLVSSLGQDFKLKTAQASKPFENGVKEVFKLTTRSGRTIRATANHPFLTWDGWTQLDQLEIGGRIAVPRILPTPKNTVPLAPYEADVLGYLLSEGNLCHPHGIYFYSTQENELADFIQAAEHFSNSSITINRSKSAASVYVGQKNQRLGNGLRVFLNLHNLLNKKAAEKFVPRIVWQSDADSIGRFLGKLWQGDGCISVQNQQVYYATSSNQLAHDVQGLLLRLGIVSTIHTKSFKYRGGIKIGWTIVVTGCENLTLFSKHAGLHLIGKKHVEMQRVVENAQIRTNTLGRGSPDTIPTGILSLLRQEMQASMAISGSTNAAAFATSFGIAPRLLHADIRKRGYTRETVKNFAVALQSEEITKHAESDVFWDEIKSIESDGKEMTYDLSVPEFENFIANDIIVHNSHAASYGKVAYQTAYMKANYPYEYMAAVLTADAGDTESISTFVDECVRMKIPVLPPDINESNADFTVATTPEGKVIRFGLTTIKNFGEGISEAIIAERNANGPFVSLSDFLCRVQTKSLNKKGLESLIKCGALDRFGDEIGGRSMLFNNIELLLSFHRDATMSAPQDSLFGAMAKPQLMLPKETEPTHTKLADKLAWEKELLGIYVSGHPLDAHAEKVAKASTTISAILAEPDPGKDLILPVLIAEVRPVLTKGGEKMAFVRFEDKTDSLEGVIFPKSYKEHSLLIASGMCVLIKGKVSLRNGETSFAVENLKAL